MKTAHKTTLGKLYQVDCMDLLKSIPDAEVDLAFADPPFNLGKNYSSKINDAKNEEEYLDWCRLWLQEMIRCLKPGGSLFLWNLPKWNLALSPFLMEHLTFRHWISVEMKYSLPIQGRLYPAHYSLLYFIKGKKPNIFSPDRMPVACCRHCGGEVKDYGGYKDKLNPKGLNLSDVWSDIPPVRHTKYKKREENALSLKLMDRIISMASAPNSLVLDPFGGSGTTYVAAELRGRRWVGSELDCASIIERFRNIDADKKHLEEIDENKNILFTKKDIKRREKEGRPLSSKYKIDEKEDSCCCKNKGEKQHAHSKP